METVGVAVGAEEVEQWLPVGALEPEGVAEQVAVIGEIGVFGGVQDAGEVVEFRDREIEVADGQQGDQGVGLVRAQRADGLVAGDEGGDLVEMDQVAGLVGELEPFDAVALDGEGEIVDGGGAVGEAEIEDVGDVRGGALVAPEQVGGVPVVMGPERGEAGGVGVEAGVEREEGFGEIVAPGVGGEIILQRGVAPCGRLKVCPISCPATSPIRRSIWPSPKMPQSGTSPSG